MFCKNCGAEIADNSRFCTDCGAEQQVSGPVITPGCRPDGKRPSTYLALSIIVTLCCCMPLGIVGIIYASRVDSAWNAGYYEDAREFSHKARNWSLLGAVLILLVWIAYIILLIAGVTWATWWENEDVFFTCLP